MLTIHQAETALFNAECEFLRVHGWVKGVGPRVSWISPYATTKDEDGREIVRGSHVEHNAAVRFEKYIGRALIKERLSMLHRAEGRIHRRGQR